jgi:hypothetical protein
VPETGISRAGASSRSQVVSLSAQVDFSPEAA